ncbi:MAG: PIN domain-containing protein [Acidobacteria bacterium]|jgi:predicted nucleic acid-binding protein|nr:PIN domain-containing protein [Acidobacteriota bacterium]HEV8157386.1 PIN domain-containing protein [Pyrinomonadaceae bacterium]
MANKILTFPDASVLIYAAIKPTANTFARRMRALQLFNDPDREFVASEFLRLEVLPIAKFFGKKREIQFYETFFAGVSFWADDAALITPALALASQHGLGALDALHICAADQLGAELVSAEKPTKPIYRAYSNISSIY